MQFNVEYDDHVDESIPLQVPLTNQSRERRRSTGIRSKGHQLENQDFHQPISKTARRKTKVQAAKVSSKFCPSSYRFEFSGMFNLLE